MTTEELLRPRYKVIALWPNTEYEIGDIVFDPSPKKQKEFFDLYPHLFQPLQWWEEREEKDMPEYIQSGGVVGKVLIHDVANGKCQAKFSSKYDKDIPYTCYYQNYTPATLAEYNEYQSKQK